MRDIIIRSVSKKIISLFYQAYPFYYYSVKRIAVMAGILTILVFLFLFFIRPFSYNYAEHLFPFWVISLFNGLLVGILFIAYTSIIRGFTPRLFLERYWTLGKEMMFWLLFIFITGIGNFFLRELIYDNPANLSLYFLALEVGHAMIIGTLLLLLIIMGKYIHIVTSTQNKAESWNRRVHSFRESESDNSFITLTSESPREEFKFRLSEFLYAMVDGNYVEIHLQNKDGHSRRYIMRNTLATIEKQLKPYSNILRVHRSYIVNIAKVNTVSGNTQGYRLRIDGSDTTVPVSRSYIPTFDTVMKR